MIKVDWNEYTSKLKGATGTDIELIQQVMQSDILY